MKITSFMRFVYVEKSNVKNSIDEKILLNPNISRI